MEHSISQYDITKILLVEESNINRQIVRSFFSENRVTIDEAENGLDALNLYTKNADYDIIFIGLQLPVLSGIAAAASIRKTNTRVPIIGLTSDLTPQNLANIRQAGMNGYMQKPFHVDKLKTILRENLVVRSDALPEFTTIDTEIGMMYLSGNAELYREILGDFEHAYRQKNLPLLLRTDPEEAFRTIHTLKGLSENVGAMQLHACIREFDTHASEENLRAFNAALKALLDELHEKLPGKAPLSPSMKRPELDHTQSSEQFRRLHGAILKQRTRLCGPIVKELENYRLPENFTILLEQIKPLLAQREFAQCARLIEEVL